MKKWFRFALAATVTSTVLLPGVSASAEAKKYSLSYLYFGNPNSYVKQVDATNGSLNVISPDYFNLKADGSLELTWKLSRTFVDEMHKRGIKVVPFLTNHWDQTKGRNALKNSEQLATQIADAIRTYNLDGVNVDLENLTDADRAAYTELVRKLYQKIPLYKEVSVAVAPNPYGATRGWQGSYDYKQLAMYSDHLVIMAYDENYAGDQTPGPVASYSFVERSIEYGLKQGVSPSKMVLGIPFYGRFWKSDNTLRGAGISNNRIDDVLGKYSGTITYDEKSQSPKATFTVRSTDTQMTVGNQKLTPGTYTIWYENDRSIQQKLRLVQKYDLKGAGTWSLNQESADTWDYYSLWLNGQYFKDTEKHWSQPHVFAMLDEGWMVGTSSNQFSPDKPMTRAQAAVILVRALNLDQQQPSAAVRGDMFWDLSPNYWAYNEIATAKQYGIISGVEDGRFLPEQAVTREAIATMLSRVLEWTPEEEVAVPFVDVDETRWSYPGILVMKQQGIITGFEDGTFGPHGVTTRAQMAVLMNRLADELKQKRESTIGE